MNVIDQVNPDHNTSACLRGELSVITSNLESGSFLSGANYVQKSMHHAQELLDHTACNPQF